MTSGNGETFDAAAERLDRAMNRLDTSMRALATRVRSVSKLEAENQRLAAELDEAKTRATRIDDTADIVSQRLSDAIETVKDVLEGDARG
jgi:prefoldin subunit 5